MSIFGELSEKDDDRRGPNRRVLPGECQIASCPIYSEGRDGVAPLITRVEEIPARINLEGPWLSAPGPLRPHKPQGARFANREIGDTIVQPVGSIDEFSVRRDHHL